MKILFVCHRFPFPPRRGGKIRPFHIIRHLQKRHHVTVASLARSSAEAAEGEGLADHCSRIIMDTVSPVAALARMAVRLPTQTPSSMGYFYSPRLARRIRQELETVDYDLIFVHCTFAALYVVGAEIPSILDFGDMDSQKWLAYSKVRQFPLSLAYYLDGQKLRWAEARLATNFDLCTCTTRAELKTLETYNVGVPLGWFPNGVDSNYFTPTAAPYVPDSITFSGRMDYYPNQECMIDFCHNILPLIRAKRPNVTFTIVGATPPRAIRNLGRQPAVTVTGSVPDIRPYVARSAVSVAPLKTARGTQNKILEAMAMGIPTVISPPAAMGVDAEPDHHFLMASSPLEYANAVIRLLENPAERRRLAEAGRARILSHHSWSDSLRTLDGLLEECMARRSRPAVCGPGPRMRPRQ